MKAKYDQVEFELPRYAVIGLTDYLRGVAKAMAKLDDEEASCWTWGRAEIGDIANSKGIQFQWGGEYNQPDDGLGDFAVVPLR